MFGAVPVFYSALPDAAGWVPLSVLWELYDYRVYQDLLTSVYADG
jgi:hypothetical protein